jgi:hypothetical protein
MHRVLELFVARAENRRFHYELSLAGEPETCYVPGDTVGTRVEIGELVEGLHNKIDAILVNSKKSTKDIGLELEHDLKPYGCKLAQLFFGDSLGDVCIGVGQSDVLTIMPDIQKRRGLVDDHESQFSWEKIPFEWMCLPAGETTSGGVFLGDVIHVTRPVYKNGQVNAQRFAARENVVRHRNRIVVRGPGAVDRGAIAAFAPREFENLKEAMKEIGDRDFVVVIAHGPETRQAEDPVIKITKQPYHIDLAPVYTFKIGAFLLLCVCFGHTFAQPFVEHSKVVVWAATAKVRPKDVTAMVRELMTVLGEYGDTDFHLVDFAKELRAKVSPAARRCFAFTGKWNVRIAND